MATPHAPQAGTSTVAEGSFRRWRRTRPFWGGLFMILAALEFLLSSNLDLGDLHLHLGPQGFLSYVIPTMMLLCGALTWVTPANRLFYGILGCLVATYSLVGLNLGGFVVGLVLGILGGALSIAWAPARAPAAAPPAEAVRTDPAADETVAGTYPGPVLPTGHQDRPHVPGQRVGHPLRDATMPDDPNDMTTEFPAFGRDGEPQSPPGSTHRRLFAITLVPTMLAALGVGLGNHTPAQAAPCPVPNYSAPSPPRSSAGTVVPRHAKPTRTGHDTAGGQPGAPDTANPAKPKNSPSAAAPAGENPRPESTKSENPVKDGWNNFIDGLKRVFEGGPLVAPEPTQSSKPATAPDADTPTKTASQPATVSPPPADPQTDPKPKPGASASSGAAPQSDSAARSASPSPSAPAVPCLGARLFQDGAADSGMPAAALRPGVLTGSKLVMSGAKYDGVVNLRTATGTVKVLQFSMKSAVTDNFRLEIPEAAGGATVVTSSELTTEGAVKFYTSRFAGNLLLLGIPIPVVFTPTLPPPLTPAEVTFTNVKIDLAFVDCHTLTAKKLAITRA